jgi:hypothetical protein
MLFERLGHFVFRHRRKVILSWCGLLTVYCQVSKTG